MSAGGTTTDPLQSHSCLARPAYRCVLLPLGQPGLVQINGTNYSLWPLGATSRDGYRLVNLDSGDIYQVTTRTGFPVCDCPDSIYRKRRCKHSLALLWFRKEGVI